MRQLTGSLFYLKRWQKDFKIKLCICSCLVEHSFVFQWTVNESIHMSRYVPCLHVTDEFSPQLSCLCKTSEMKQAAHEFLPMKEVKAQCCNHLFVCPKAQCFPFTQTQTQTHTHTQNKRLALKLQVQYCMQSMLLHWRGFMIHFLSVIH